MCISKVSVFDLSFSCPNSHRILTGNVLRLIEPDHSTFFFAFRDSRFLDISIETNK